MSIIPVTIVAALGGLLFGYDTGVINGSQYYLSQYFDLSAAEKGWVVGSALLGCLLGALAAGKLSIVIGRKHSLIISAILFTLSAWGSGLPSVFPESVSLLVFFRVIGGLGIGIASMNAPMYIAEIAPADKRGAMVTFYQLAIVIGFFIVFVATYLIGDTLTTTENIERGWRLMFWSELLPCSIFLVGLLFIPQSPRWLALKGRHDQAKIVLEQLHGKVSAQLAFTEIQQSLKGEQRKLRVSIWQKGTIGIVIIGTVFSSLQQFTGINAVLYFGADIFEKALGFGKEDVLAPQILLAGVNLCFTFIAMALVDKVGRKPLIYAGCIGMFTGFLLLSATLISHNVGLVSLIGVLIFIGSFAMSMGPVVWVMLSEMFPNSIRSAAMSVAVAAQWASNYVVAQTFPIIAESEFNNSAPWEGSIPYVIFMVFIFGIAIFTKYFIPETKGRSLEELESIWDTNLK
jgi:SP family xylose:H+ symportor-like MFS transporter